MTEGEGEGEPDGEAGAVDVGAGSGRTLANAVPGAPSKVTAQTTVTAAASTVRLPRPIPQPPKLIYRQ
ncbi:hypothetical protein ACE1SV_32590 [Streptomyces sennicomposti]